MSLRRRGLLLGAWVLFAAASGRAAGEQAVAAQPKEAPSSLSTAAPQPKPYPRLYPGFWNSLYAYNGENGAWEQTRITITYFENLFQPYAELQLNEKLHFRVGAGLVIPMDQEQKIRSFYPYVQSKLLLEGWTIELGSLDGNHDFPAPLLDPLISLVPQIRLGASDQIPINYEKFPVTGKYTHGLYEYGLAFRWSGTGNVGEIYINWHLPDTADHRERFDIGLTNRRTVAGLPLYFGAHYWHNGGHENPHPVPITENYTAALGLRDDRFSVLALGSIWYADRDSNKSVNGTAFYADYIFRLGRWRLQPVLFVSDELRNHGNRFISVEGDPFFRVPFYAGLNVGARWELLEGCTLDFGLFNGFFQKTAQEKFNPTKVRYDQMLRLNVRYQFGKENG